jgi:hypothetical protein
MARGARTPRAVAYEPSFHQQCHATGGMAVVVVPSGDELLQEREHAERLAAEPGACELPVHHSDRSRADTARRRRFPSSSAVGAKERRVAERVQDDATFRDLLRRRQTSRLTN